MALQTTQSTNTLNWQQSLASTSVANAQLSMETPVAIQLPPQPFYCKQHLPLSATSQPTGQGNHIMPCLVCLPTMNLHWMQPQRMMQLHCWRGVKSTFFSSHLEPSTFAANSSTSCSQGGSTGNTKGPTSHTGNTTQQSWQSWLTKPSLYATNW